MGLLRNRSGQYIPITAMVAFTTVVFLVAVVNIFQVAQAKLKVQNLADAVALNIASQMASSMNKVADLNEWMNHPVDMGPNATPSKPGSVPDCHNINPDLPPISCAENTNDSGSLNKFTTKGTAASYATLVQTINQAQLQFISAYNNFIGAGTGSNSSISTQSSLNSILFSDIPELGENGTSIFVWNSQSGKATPQDIQKSAALLTGNFKRAANLNTSGMQPLNFQVRSMKVTYKTTVPILNIPGPDITKSLGQFLTSGNSNVPDVGWMEPSADQPSISVSSSNGGKTRIGVGAVVIRAIPVPLFGTVIVKAQAQAYLVSGSGRTGDMVPDPNNPALLRPVFQPTYWVKLATM
jgi:hypothetical protein